MNGISAATGASEQAPVVIERSYDARVEDLWALWTTKDGFESWWGPVGFRVEVKALEARRGGALDYEMIADAPEAIAAMKRMGQPLTHRTRGMYSEFEPHERLTLVHVIDFVPGSGVYQSLIDVSFGTAEGKARMTVSLHPHPDPHWTRMTAQGFGSQLTKLDERFGWSGG
ncbi:activator of Hsp90 ATPase 1 family protein [Bosea sp. Root381]|uniref:SRPBCC family protein n=1 Tax=Bosea sp. Root381 TaxID=1736524 RepID=UPI0006FB6921|nr:SRPBCC domain-containing protein [Bosea sp. Root381]KRE13444.1 activator of Hsp90 ATPase 1 family protein [Bosea sp. Root381]